jgi:hypothetical protein
MAFLLGRQAVIALSLQSITKAYLNIWIKASLTLAFKVLFGFECDTIDAFFDLMVGR